MAAGPPKQDRREQTLGDLLYAKGAPAPVAEKAWRELVELVGRGDQLALHALFARMHRIVFTLILRITGNQQTAEEVTLDVFHDVWRKASTYDPAGGSVVGWIMNQARSRAIDRVRFDRRKKRVDDADRALPVIGPEGPHEALDVCERGRLLRHALQALTPQERQAIEAAFFSELTYREVAARLDQPLGTVKTRIRSGLSKLRQLLAGGLTGL